MKFEPTTIPQCILIIPEVKKDARGQFVKTFSDPLFQEQHLKLQWKESFYTLSKRNVLRGLHFQIPPFHHDKLVACLKGEIFDVVVDLRKGSPTYGQSMSILMNEDNCYQLFIPNGLAHGFLTLSSEAIVLYNTTSPYSPAHDLGISWKSATVTWPISKPLISKRDKSFPSFHEFNSPFKFSSP